MIFTDKDNVLVRVSRENVFRVFTVEGMSEGAPELFNFQDISRKQDFLGPS